MDSKKRLKDILQGVDVISIDGNINIDIAGVAVDSKAVRDGFVFIAVKGASCDGHDFIDEAIKKGAKAVVVCRGTACRAPTTVVVADSTAASAYIAHNFYDRPADKARVIGITGTNGKTTISYLCESIFREAGFSAGVIGTINYRYGLRQIPATNTTPGSLKLAEMMNCMVTGGAGYVVMEVSSHSLKQGRTIGIDFKTAVFTNITPEHLDYHKEMKEYKKAKAMLFRNLAAHATAVLNIDDEFGKELAEEIGSVGAGRDLPLRLTYGLGKNADIHPDEFSLLPSGIETVIVTPAAKLKVQSRLVGKFNLYNILASVGIGIAEHIGLDKIAAGIERIDVVPGRLEEVFCGQPFAVYVDYAHTDDALKNVLTTLREITKGKLITLFGCGGDRDTAKRPRMGKVASELSDYVVITTDNPRSEDPAKIAEQIVSGIAKDKINNSFVVLDRQEAIKHALSLARERDTVLLAGKGHETYQIFKNRYESFDDRDVAKKLLLDIGCRNCMLMTNDKIQMTK